MQNFSLILKRFFEKYTKVHPPITLVDLNSATGADYDLPLKWQKIVLADNYTTPWDFNLPAARGSECVITISNQDNATVVVNPDGTDTINGATDAISILTMTSTTFVDYSAGKWATVSASGLDGDSSYVYIAYASDSIGTDFTNTFNAALDYIAILATDTEIPTPQASDFAGLWKNYKGETGAAGTDGADGADAPTFYISDTYPSFSDGEDGDYWSRYTLVCVTPTAFPAGGTYGETQSVYLSTGTASATIYYTTNGTVPTSASTQYTGAISVSASLTLKFIAIKTGYAQSAISTEVYTIT